MAAFVKKAVDLCIDALIPMQIGAAVATIIIMSNLDASGRCPSCHELLVFSVPPPGPMGPAPLPMAVDPKANCAHCNSVKCVCCLRPDTNEPPTR